ncbi:hypothetical protein G893_04125 [Escherichia coli KOEGE 71 (186a)]|nr:hypothetical protein G893_04125 [Escherichia coli KOEGE 71 (186a)]
MNILLISILHGLRRSLFKSIEISYHVVTKYFALASLTNSVGNLMRSSIILYLYETREMLIKPSCYGVIIFF